MTTPIEQVISGATRWHIEHGDSAIVAKAIPDASIDAIVADPPAGIAFMGKTWDEDKGGESEWIAWLAGILREGHRVLKPGGHCLLWALPRTSDWTMQALRRAGFEVRDVVTHLFGSGFPKSLDVSKAIDKTGGSSPADEGDALRERREEAGLTREQLADAVGCSVKSIENWEDGRPRKARGPVERIVPGPEFRDKLAEVLGYPPDERTVVGPGTAKRDVGAVLGLGHTGKTYGAPATPEARRWSGFGTALKPASEFWILARKPLDGTVAANVLAHGTGGLNIDAARVGTAGGTAKGTFPNGDSVSAYGHGLNGSCDIVDIGKGRWPSNLLLSHTAWEETHCPCGAVLSFVARFCPECGSAGVEHRRAGCCAVGERRVRAGYTLDNGPAPSTDAVYGKYASRSTVTHADPDGLETVTAWECLSTCACGLSTLAPAGGAPPRCRCGRAMTWACPVARLDEQSGERPGGAPVATARQGFAGASYMGGGAGTESFDGYPDTGGASRFFNCFAPPDDAEPFFWCAKPSAAETEAGCEALPLRTAAENVDREEGSAGTKSPRAGAGRLSGRRNHHATKKSVALMAHFCRLATPPGGIILDMFAGSGSTGCAATLHGFRFIGIEQDPDYAAIARARVTFWARLAGTAAVKAGAGKPRPKREDSGESGQGRLF